VAGAVNQRRRRGEVGLVAAGDGYKPTRTLRVVDKGEAGCRRSLSAYCMAAVASGTSSSPTTAQEVESATSCRFDDHRLLYHPADGSTKNNILCRCMHACMHACMDVCYHVMYMRMCMCMFMCSVCVCMCMSICVYMCMRMRMCICSCMYRCLYTYSERARGREGERERVGQTGHTDQIICGGAPPAPPRMMTNGSNAYLAARRLLNILPCEYV